MKKGECKALAIGKVDAHLRRAPCTRWQSRKQHYETISVKSEAQARRLLGKRLDAIEAGEFEASSKMTFGDLLDRYFDARKGRLQETTLALYRRTIESVHWWRP